MANLKTRCALAIGVLMATTLPSSSAHADKRGYEHYHKDSYGNIIAAEGHDNGKQGGSATVFLDEDVFRRSFQRGVQAQAEIARQQREIDQAAPKDGAAAKPIRFYTKKLLHVHVELISKNVFKIIEGNTATGWTFTTDDCNFDGSSREATFIGSLVVFGEKPEPTMTCNMGQVFPK